MLSTNFFPSTSAVRVVVVFLLLLAVSAVVVLPEPAYALVDPAASGKDGTVPIPKVKDSAKPAADDGVVQRIIDKFESKTKAWEGTIAGLAENLLALFAVFEVCWIGFRLVLGRENPGDAIKQLVMFILMAGFFLAVIRNYDAWSSNLIDGLAHIGDGMGASAKAAQEPFGAGLELVRSMWDKLSAGSPIDSLGLIFAGLVVLFCFALIAARMVIIKCEAAVAMAATLLLIGFGGSSMFKEYAINAIRYVLAVAFKLFTLQLIMAIGMEFINEFKVGSTQLVDLMVVIAASVVLVALVSTLPDTVAGVVTGSHISGSSGAGLGAAGAAVGGAAVGAIGGAVAAGGGAMAAGGTLNSASKLATLAGATGVGKGVHMAKSLLSSGSEAKQKRSSRSEIMKERLETALQKNNGDA